MAYFSNKSLIYNSVSNKEELSNTIIPNAFKTIQDITLDKIDEEAQYIASRSLVNYLTPILNHDFSKISRDSNLYTHISIDLNNLKCKFEIIKIFKAAVTSAYYLGKKIDEINHIKEKIKNCEIDVNDATRLTDVTGNVSMQKNIKFKPVYQCYIDTFGWPSSGGFDPKKLNDCKCILRRFCKK